MFAVMVVLTCTNARVRESTMPAVTVDALLVLPAPLPGVA